ncbi:MAG: archease [Deltaproteobacteria bacterium]
MRQLHYEFIEHTADIGIRVRAPDEKSLFVDAALSMFDMIARKVSTQSSERNFPIELGAENREELFVAWLNELLSLSTTENVIVSDIDIERLRADSLKARVRGESMASYEFKTEVKAATYHGLKVEQSGKDWLAEVIFDV